MQLQQDCTKQCDRKLAKLYGIFAKLYRTLTKFEGTYMQLYITLANLMVH